MSRCPAPPTGTSRPRRVRAFRRPTVLVGVAACAAGLLTGLASAPVAVAAPATGSPLGNLDITTADSDTARFAGWAYDPDAGATPISVMVTVDGTVVAQPVASGDRPDVAAAHPDAGPSHGFDVSLAGQHQGTHMACLWGVNVGPGETDLLACRWFTVAVDPFGNLDVATAAGGAVTVAGWAIDPDTTSAIDVLVSIDGGPATRVHAGQSRPDVGRAYPVAGAQHGFTATLGSLAQGNHTVCVTAADVGPGSDTALGCRTVLSWVLPIGNLDVVTADHDRATFGGWALDPDTNAPLQVQIFVDGSLLTTVTANQSRPDIAAAYPLWGPAHGFTGSVGPLAQGTHTVCAAAVNLDAGTGAPQLACAAITTWILPVGNLDSASVAGSTLSVAGWALDPDTDAPIPVDVYDGTTNLGRLTAGGPRTDVAARYPASGANHGFTGTFTGLGDGPHTVCAYAINAGPGGQNPLLACRSVVVATMPIGHVDAVSRTSPTSVSVSGWTIDPDTNAPVTIAVTANGGPAVTYTASASRPDVGSAYPAWGPNHGFAVAVPIAAAETTLCVTARNIGPGSDTPLGCTDVPRFGATAPPPPPGAHVTPGYGTLTVTWDAPADNGGSVITSYSATALYTSQTVTVSPDARKAVFTGLMSNTYYGIAIYATNAVGTSTPALPGGTTLATPPPQTTTPMVSTSRYLRALNGSSTDITSMYAAGKTDAARNTSGHAYVSLLDIGGQSGSGVVLSATSHYLSDVDLVTALRSYLDGYASAQNASAPVTITIGTNNDTDVSYASGQVWAQAVIEPLASYAARYPGVTVAAADDIEPGFRQGPAATRSWLSGYLASTSAPFVNNGSADGCSPYAAGSPCNNGWTMADLQWVSGGAAPGRIQVMPQIYNTTMPKQWNYISLTGVTGGGPALAFGGALTELGACGQAGGCSSLDGATAWNALWAQLRSDGRISPSSLPWATDLMIS